MIEWATPDGQMPASMSFNDPVFRVSYNCSGDCLGDGEWEDEPVHPSQQAVNLNSDDEEMKKPKHNPRRTNCPSKARLQV